METTSDRPASFAPSAHRDPLFGVNSEFNLGMLPHDLDIDRQVKGIDVLSDDKILIAASLARHLIGHIGLIRLEANGNLDATFADQGLALGSVAGSYDCGAGKVAFQAPGLIIMLGWMRRIADGPRILVITRFNDQGSIDRGFGNEGHVVIDPSHLGMLDDDSGNVHLLPHGKVLVSANYKNGSHSTGLLVRIDSQGNLDRSFNASGLLEIKHAVFTSTTANGLRVQADKQILVAGGAQPANANVQGYVARYSDAGVLDLTFGGPDVPGFSTMQLGSAAVTFNTLLAAAEDKVIGVGQISGDKDWAVLVGFDSSGGGYPEFNNGSPVLTSFVEELGSGWFDAHIQADGKIVCAGGPNRLYMVRYDAHGAIDRTFGVNGLIEEEEYSLLTQQVFVRTQTNGRTILAANTLGLGSGYLFGYIKH
ncbi:delta-60 repeat domain-containing protein [Pseudomonas sp. Ant30-3]|uniref:delta-60 repeat domain-containing protein n=1 Tax=Pseudomonas sp. Ant30-3 TaxID=1488328 RepID=UPI00048E8F37|nr:delta-60 repeat domain-containing protein [Pseudomonas sp. Ant30-3]